MRTLYARALEVSSWHAGRGCDRAAGLLEEAAGWLRWVAVAMRCVP